MTTSFVPVIKVQLALWSLDDEGLLAFLLHDAGVDEVAHQDGCTPIIGRCLLKLGGYLLGLYQLVLDLIDPGPSGTVRVLFGKLRLLVLLDLLLRSSSLAADLEHNRRDAVVLYST